MRYLLDSTVLIDHANRDEPAAELLERLFSGPNELYTCDIVTCETLSQGDPDHLRHLRVLLNALEYVATTPDAARWAANSRHNRHKEGRKLGLGDSLDRRRRSRAGGHRGDAQPPGLQAAGDRGPELLAPGS